MSELIEFRREKAIREYECMKHLKLFTDAEINDIKAKRHYHDYKVEKRSKNLADFINYIGYECNLFKLLLQRRKKLRIKAEWASLEKSINNRIRGLYKRAMVRFASDYRVWTHFLQYCKMRRSFNEGSRILDQMLGYHGDKSKAWLSAINWEYHQAQNMTRAKHYTLRGLQRHPECCELCLSFIAIQMSEAETIVKESKKTAKELLEADHRELTKALKITALVYKNFQHKDVSFFEQLTKELQKYRPLSDAIAQEAVSEMRTMLADKEGMWDLQANLALQGDEFVLGEMDAKFTQRLEKCIAIYKEGIDRIPSKQMHSFYIQRMLEINANETQLGDEKVKRKALATAFKTALMSDQLEEEKLVKYLKLLLHNNNPKEDFIMVVINKGIEQYPSSVEIWSSYLRYLSRKEVDIDEFEKIFQKAIVSLPDNVSKLPLWKMVFQHYNIRPDLHKKIEQLYRQAIDQDPEISHHFQLLFMDYLLLVDNGDMTRVRSEYQRLVKNYTTTIDLHRKMASIEASQDKPDVNEWRKCHEYATQFHGKTDPTTWLQYVQFERDHGKAKHMQALYNRAKSVLNEDLFGNFLSEYEIIRNPYIARY
ncbi:U3 small nucleolar RNA-associated protein 6 homolog [Anopheles nili]|uniref:U3 small nucleolar RNA-associated protein 6 homolog n=1 Tax=Anopheles nili TaxID=185578 RepID=UPI00237A71B2|nr:U3 small nucleolar RNA-associated protein 6 homolog [Anopheles nili]